MRARPSLTVRSSTDKWSNRSNPTELGDLEDLVDHVDLEALPLRREILTIAIANLLFTELRLM